MVGAFVLIPFGDKKWQTKKEAFTDKVIDQSFFFFFFWFNLVGIRVHLFRLKILTAKAM